MLENEIEVSDKIRGWTGYRFDIEQTIKKITVVNHTNVKIRQGYDFGI